MRTGLARGGTRDVPALRVLIYLEEEVRIDLFALSSPLSTVLDRSVPHPALTFLLFIPGARALERKAAELRRS